jgi:hypothetical protein
MTMLPYGLYFVSSSYSNATLHESFPSQSTSRTCPTARTLALYVTTTRPSCRRRCCCWLLSLTHLTCHWRLLDSISLLRVLPLLPVSPSTQTSQCDVLSSTSYEAGGGAGEGMWNSPSFLRRSRSWRFFDRSARTQHRIESLELVLGFDQRTGHFPVCSPAMIDCASTFVSTRLSKLMNCTTSLRHCNVRSTSTPQSSASPLFKPSSIDTSLCVCLTTKWAPHTTAVTAKTDGSYLSNGNTAQPPRKSAQRRQMHTCSSSRQQTPGNRWSHGVPSACASVIFSTYCTSFARYLYSQNMNGSSKCTMS